jgi:hypothetical protein
MLTRAVWAGLLLLTGLASAGLAWSLISPISPARTTPAPAHTGNPADDLQRAILADNVGRPGDPALSALFVEVAARHFQGQLAPVAVRWEPELASVGAMHGNTYTLQGMFGAAGSRSVILLNPALRGDNDAVLRALCHEMVHAYLYATGDDSTTHGPAFQAVLRRLSEEGAFTGIVADPDERARVRAWLDAESARLDAERASLDELGAEVMRDRSAIEQATHPDEAMVSAHNERAMTANARAERFNRDFERFRAEVARYNLMVVYPHGIEEAARR